MRKVKLLALLLAALMVVAAFAGCADTKEIESDVANLDERVSALEGKIDGVGSDLSDVKDAIEADKTAEELKALQDAVKAQEDANKELLDAIKALEEKLAQQDETIKDLPASDEGLAQAQKDAAADIAARKAVYENNKADYATKDYEAILTILEVAKTEVAAAAKSADVKAIVAQMDTDLAKYTAYDDQLYIYVTKLLGNISAASAKLNEEARDYLKAAKKHYGTSDEDLAPLTKYVYGVDEDGNDLTVNLVDVLDKINTLQTSKDSTVTITISGKATTYATLYQITKDAAALDKEYTRLDAKEVVDIISDNLAGALYGKYTTWLKQAKALGEENVKLLTKADEIVELASMVKNVTDAMTAYGQLGELDYKTYKYGDILAEYVTLATEDAAALIDVDGKAVKKTYYDKIDAAIAGWKTTYGFDDEFAAAVIAQYYAADDDETNDGRYEQYVADRDYVAYMESAYTTFVKDIVPAIKDVNAMSSLKAAEIEAYVDLEAAIADWRIVVEADAKNDIKEVAVDDANFKLMLTRQELLIDEKEDTFFDKDKDYAPIMANIVAFENDDEDKTIANFFSSTGDYAKAQTYATGLRKLFNTVNTNKDNYASLATIYAIEGEFKQVKAVNPAVYAEGTEDYKEYSAYIGLYVEASDFLSDDKNIFIYEEVKGVDYTIAEFEEEYGQYGLTALLETVPASVSGQKNLATFESAKATVEKKLESAADDYVAVINAIKTINYQKAWKKSSTLYTVETEGAVVKYLVNLDNKDAVEAAVKARSAWEAKYLGGIMKAFQAAVDEDDKVISGAYEFVSIEDADWDKALTEMADVITTADTHAKALVAHLEAIAAALAFVKTEAGADFNFVTTDLATLQFVVAVTAVTTYNNKYAVKNYRVNALGSVDNYASERKALYDGEVNPEDLDTLMDLLRENKDAVPVADLLDAGYKAYQTFKTVNLKYTAGSEKYTSSYRAYAPVEDAIKAVAEIDLAYAKALTIDKISELAKKFATDNAGKTIDANVIARYVQDAKDAKSYSELSTILSAMVNAEGINPMGGADGKTNTTEFKIYATTIKATKAVD